MSTLGWIITVTISLLFTIGITKFLMYGSDGGHPDRRKEMVKGATMMVPYVSVLLFLIGTSVFRQ